MPTVVIRIVPSSAGAAGVFGGPFRVLRYAEHQPLVYLDTTVGGLFLEDQEFVATYGELIPTVADLALDEGQSREFIAALANELDRGSDQRHGHDRVEEEQLQQRWQQ
ncbi:Scr1 family TA system antitoxin-like transcriptional regulator [Actinophytocola sp.]|uniref:Scr1 family TA system antitoxin-like transcriptional regulator n=1 Tax=Actinophytocola sp. TaxID=1872138 RepID=UPI0025C51348|nr:Scr1 family TA system antitoxin-like transcriptional regulator [Actinophytocola sp.]